MTPQVKAAAAALQALMREDAELAKKLKPVLDILTPPTYSSAVWARIPEFKARLALLNESRTFDLAGQMLFMADHPVVEVPGFCPTCGLPLEKHVFKHLKGSHNLEDIQEDSRQYRKTLPTLTSDELSQMSVPRNKRYLNILLEFLSRLPQPAVPTVYDHLTQG